MAKKEIKNKKAPFFRRKADELLHIKESLESQLEMPGADFSPLLTAAKELERIADSPNTPSTWGYNIQNLILPMGSIRNIEPQGIMLKICISCKIEGDIEKWNSKSGEDPFSNYSFQLSVFGEQNDMKYSRGFHIDRDSAEDSEECHPLYHMHFYDGVYDNGQSLKDEVQQRGSVSIRTPRFSHYPLDIVLGIGFYLLNFHKVDVFTHLYNTNEWFSRLYADSQKRILEPYYLTISDSLKSQRDNMKNCKPLCPQIV